MTRPKSIALLVIAAALTAKSPAAKAQDTAAAARLLYDEARALLKAEKYAPACPKLERSLSLSEAADTKFWLGDCYEHTGRPTSAWRLFGEVADETKAQGNQAKATYARQRAEALVPRLSKVRIRVPPAAAASGLEIKRDGKPVDRSLWDQEVPVDPGEHVIRATAPGKKPWEEARTITEGAVMEITVPGLEDGSTSEGSPSASATPGTRWLYVGPAIGAAGVGVAGVIVGAIYGSNASSQWNQGHKECPVDCPRGSAPYDLITDANASANISNAGFIVGGVALAASAVLFYLGLRAPSASPPPALSIVPSAGPGHAGMVIRASF